MANWRDSDSVEEEQEILRDLVGVTVDGEGFLKGERGVEGREPRGMEREAMSLAAAGVCWGAY